MPEPEHWTQDRVDRWLRQAAGIERQLAPVSEVLFAAARLRPGESVLDVGCGTGPTTLVAAEAVAPNGRVVGMDISGDMLAAAASSVPAGLAPIEWLEADAVTWEPDDAAYDVVLSRFGVMFFSDPSAAFANLARATGPGGRLAIAVWPSRDESEVFALPLQAAVRVFRSREIRSLASGVELDEFLARDDEGPFSLSDTTQLTALLHDAGWSDVEIERHTLDLPFGGGLSPVDAAAAALDFGPTRILLTGAGDDVIRAAQDAIAEAFAAHLDGDRHVVLSAGVLIVTATRR